VAAPVVEEKSGLSALQQQQPQFSDPPTLLREKKSLENKKSQHIHYNRFFLVAPSSLSQKNLKFDLFLRLVSRHCKK
jgi:hypothetical protein